MGPSLFCFRSDVRLGVHQGPDDASLRTRRRFLMACLAGTASSMVPTHLLAQAQPNPDPYTPRYPPNPKPFEVNTGNAIGRWTGRIETNANAANDNAVRVAVANRWNGVGGALLRGAGGFLRVGARLLGWVGVALTIGELFMWLTGRDDKFDLRNVPTYDPSRVEFEVAWIEAGSGSGDPRASPDGQKFRMSTHEHGQVSEFQNKRPGWHPIAMQNGEIEDTPAGPRVKVRVIWESDTLAQNPALGPFAPPFVPQADATNMVPWEDLQARANAYANSQLDPASVVRTLNQILDDAHQAFPNHVPNPRQNPLTQADLGDDVWRLGDWLDSLLGLDRGINFGGQPGLLPNPLPEPVSPSPDPSTGLDWGTFSPPGFQLPALEVPEVPTVPDLINQLANPLQSIIPNQPSGSAPCPPFPWFMGQTVTQHCGAMEPLQPLVGNIARISANIAAFFIVLRD